MPRKATKQEPRDSKKERGGKLSLYPLTVEEALRAAAQTGRPPPEKPKRPVKKRTERKT